MIQKKVIIPKIFKVKPSHTRTEPDEKQEAEFTMLMTGAMLKCYQQESWYRRCPGSYTPPMRYNSRST